MSLPKTMKAYKCTGPDKAALVDAPLPKLRPDYLLVKVNAVALNPTDWKHIKGIPTEGATVGCDFAGEVLEIGNTVTKSFKKGDRVACFTHGVNAVQPEDGAFAEYAVCKGDLTFKLPDHLTNATGSTLGVGIVTVGQALYQHLDLPRPSSPSKTSTPVLIYGGSTATGLFALQFARESGLEVLTTCSPKNFSLVKSYGAAQAFDYSDPECGKKIREYTNDKLEKAFDCISEGTSVQICTDAIGSAGGQYLSLLPVEFPRSDVKNGYTLGYTVTGERFTFRGGMEFKANRGDFEFGVRHIAEAEGLLEEKRVVPVPIEERSGGLGKVGEGLEDLKNGKVSGRKIVYVL